MKYLAILSVLLIAPFAESFAQNTGIGTSTPGSRLTIKGAAGSTSLLNVTDNADASKLMVLNGGNVGIGESNPTYKLEVKGNFRTVSEGFNYMDNTTADGYNGLYFRSFSNSNTEGGFILKQDDSEQTGGTTTEDVRFTIGVHNDFRTASTGHSDEMWFQGGGRLVYNVGNWDSELTTILGATSAGTTGGHEWRVNNTAQMTLDHSGNLDLTSGKITSLADPTSAQDAATKNYTDNQVSTNDDWTLSGSNLYPKSSAYNVGIGNTAPGSHKLNVTGTTYISSSLFVSQGGATGGGIALADDGDIVDMNDGYASHRFTYGLRMTNGNRTGSTVVQIANGVAGSGHTYFNTGNNFGIGTASPGYKLHVAGDIYANGGWLRVSGNNGLYFESWGGGWYMSDATWVRSNGNKNVFTAGTMQADATMESAVFNFGNYNNASLPGFADGQLYRYAGQGELRVDDWFYMRDADNVVRIRFNTDGGNIDVDGVVDARSGLRTEKNYKHYKRTRGNGGGGTDNMGNYDICYLVGTAFRNTDSYQDEDDDYQCNVYPDFAATGFNEGQNEDTYNTKAYNARPYWYLYSECYADCSNTTCSVICINFE